ncbi:MAG: HAD hydrolase family protein [Acidobacteriota bacterium]|nr:HAD hydrolase family protein [Acidobacteriota bacterium]
MRYLAVATDFDGTVFTDGQMPTAVSDAIARLRESGRRTILVTGRRLDDLLEACPRVDLFDYIIAENGALAFEPSSRTETTLCKAPPARFVKRLSELGVAPLEVGKVILSTLLPNHLTVLQAIQETGLELLVIFNKSAVMILPSGVNKATGLDYALRKLGLSFHETVGIGDAENDQSFLQSCECSFAVANATQSVKDLASFVTKRSAGEGVAEVIDELIADDLARIGPELQQHFIELGVGLDGSPVMLSPYGTNILIIGPSASGKSTVTAGIVERLISQKYQVCLVDPEGDHTVLQEVMTLGDQNHPFGLHEAIAILEDPKVNLNLNLLGIPLADRPKYFGQLFGHLQTLRLRTSRPHWIVLDEAHHLLPHGWGPFATVLPQRIGELILVTVHPDHLDAAILSQMDVVITVGPDPEDTLCKFCEAVSHPMVWPEGLQYSPENAVVWFVRSGEAPYSMRILLPTADRARHRRKYAEGNMQYHSFYFRGPYNQVNLKAQNLTIFVQLAKGVDDETWMFHLRRGDYSKWFREAVKDRYLADQAERIEQRENLPSWETRQLICGLIDARYTLPE